MPRLSSRCSEDAPRGELSRAPLAFRTWPGECALALRKLLCGESRAESRALRSPRGEVSLLPATSPPSSSILFAAGAALSALSALACTASTSATSSSVDGRGSSRGGGTAKRRRSASPSAAVTRAAVTEAVITSAVDGAPPGDIVGCAATETCSSARQDKFGV